MTKEKNELDKLLSVSFMKIRKDYSLILKKRNRNKEDRAVVLNNLESFLYGRPYKMPDRKKIKNITEKDVFIEKLCVATNEVTSSLYKLYITMALVSKLRSNKMFTKEDLLQYYYENYINELYIYTERILNIITLVEKKAEKLQLKIYYNILVGARRIYADICKDVRNIRNEHNHKIRFSDYHIARLKVIDSELIKPYISLNDKDKIYRIIKKKYCKEMLEEVISMYKMTQTIFVPIEVIVYDAILPKL
jgi:hypothetical protein